MALALLKMVRSVLGTTKRPLKKECVFVFFE